MGYWKVKKKKKKTERITLLEVKVTSVIIGVLPQNLFFFFLHGCSLFSFLLFFLDFY